MRLFAGIPVPPPAQLHVAALILDLQSRQWPVRWVRPETLHLTLKFFGTVQEAMAQALVPALATASDGIGAIPLSCTGIGSFPPGRRARVIWMGIDAPGALELLQDALERACVPLGFPIEGRPFRPHITLGRVREEDTLPARAIESLDDAPEIPFLAEQLVLFRSQPGPGGSVYRELYTFPLGPCAAA